MNQRMLPPAVVGALALASCGLNVSARECAVRAPRSATVDATGAKTVHIEAREGDLRARGAVSNQVVVEGEACARDQRTLDRIELIAERRGDEVWIEARVPDGRGARRLDLEIALPRAVEVVIRDTSGGIRVEDIGGLDLHDSSGDVVVRGVAGDARIEDSSGGLEIERVEGSLWVSDGSGDIEIRGVGGSATIERDGSGDIAARDVGRDFVVRRDGSGGIRAEDVKGDFVVERDGSGDVDFARVEGRTPTRRR